MPRIAALGEEMSGNCSAGQVKSIRTVLHLAVDRQSQRIPVGCEKPHRTRDILQDRGIRQNQAGLSSGSIGKVGQELRIVFYGHGEAAVGGGSGPRHAGWSLLIGSYSLLLLKKYPEYIQTYGKSPLPANKYIFIRYDISHW